MNDNNETFSIHVEGDTSGDTWTGNFVTKIWLSHREFLRIDQIRRTLLGETPSNPSDRAANTAAMLAELQVRLVEYPPFWKDSGYGLDLVDDNVVGAIWDKVQDKVKERLAAKQKAAKAQQDRMRDEAKKAEAQEQK